MSFWRLTNIWYLTNNTFASCSQKFHNRRRLLSCDHFVGVSMMPHNTKHKRDKSNLKTTSNTNNMCAIISVNPWESNMSNYIPLYTTITESCWIWHAEVTWCNLNFLSALHFTVTKKSSSGGGLWAAISPVCHSPPGSPSGCWWWGWMKIDHFWQSFHSVLASCMLRSLLYVFLHTANTSFSFSSLTFCPFNSFT